MSRPYWYWSLALERIFLRRIPSAPQSDCRGRNDCLAQGSSYADSILGVSGFLQRRFLLPRLRLIPERAVLRGVYPLFELSTLAERAVSLFGRDRRLLS